MAGARLCDADLPRRLPQPADYRCYEAAKLDGASGPQAFWYISVPLLQPITLYVSVVTLISGFNVYAQAYVLASDAQGAPGRQVRVLVLDMLENCFRNYRVGYAASEAMVLLAIVLVLTADPVHAAARQGAEMTMSLSRRRAEIVADPPPPPRTRAINLAIDIFLFVFCAFMMLCRWSSWCRTPSSRRRRSLPGRRRSSRRIRSTRQFPLGDHQTPLLRWIANSAAVRHLVDRCHPGDLDDGRLHPRQVPLQLAERHLHRRTRHGHRAVRGLHDPALLPGEDARAAQFRPAASCSATWS